MSKNQKKIWITGASSGIGKAVAEKFAQEGWQVAISARRKEILDDMAKNPNISSKWIISFANLVSRLLIRPNAFGSVKCSSII